jgi:hypothetical protein
VLRREDDFDTWLNIFVATVEPGCEFFSCLPDFECLLTSSCDSGALADLISRSTDQFTTMLLLSIITGIFGLTGLSSSEIDAF